MRLADPVHNVWWMSDQYLAPEVTLKLPWNFPVDLWSVVVMVAYIKSWPREKKRTKRQIQTFEFVQGKNCLDPSFLFTSNTLFH